MQRSYFYFKSYQNIITSVHHYVMNNNFLPRFIIKDTNDNMILNRMFMKNKNSKSPIL